MPVYIITLTLTLSHFYACAFSSQLFCKQNKALLEEGDTIRFPKLADTMETIAKQGADALYNGQIGLDLVQDVREAGQCRRAKGSGFGLWNPGSPLDLQYLN